MEKKKVIKFLVVALFTVSIQLISVYAVPDNNEQIVSEEINVDESNSVATLDNFRAIKE